MGGILEIVAENREALRLDVLFKVRDKRDQEIRPYPASPGKDTVLLKSGMKARVMEQVREPGGGIRYGVEEIDDDQ